MADAEAQKKGKAAGSLRDTPDGSLRVCFALSWPPYRRSGRLQTGSSSSQQPSSHEEQVSEREQREQPRPGLGKAAIARLHVTDWRLSPRKGCSTLARTIAMKRGTP
jgi:hypothetical protein